MNATKIKEEAGDSFTSKKIVKNIVNNFEYLLKSFKALSDVADKAGDNTTAAFTDDNVASCEKELWILRAMLS